LVTKVEKKIEDILGEDQFEFGKGKGNGCSWDPENIRKTFGR